jgi:hypothetical protein
VASSNAFNGNHLDGLRVITKGDIDAGAITAGSNTTNGTYFDNSTGSGHVHLNGAGNFSGNTNSGLQIFSTGQITSTTGITASNNATGYGAYINSNDTINPVTLSGTNTFNNNHLDGLHIEAKSDIILDNVTANSNGGNGLFLQSPGNITLHGCTNAAYNGGYGIYAHLPGGYIFYMRTGTINGNGILSYWVDGGGTDDIAECTPIPPPETTKHPNKPINVVHVSGGESVLLACDLYSGTLLILPNGDSAFLPCPISGSVTLTSLSRAGHALPDGATFASGMDLRVTPDANSSANPDAAMTISFVVPGNQRGANLAILHWSGGKWQEVSSINTGGHLVAQVDFDGVFVMVSR